MAAGLAEAGAATRAQVADLDFEYASVVALLAEDGAKPDYAGIDEAAGTMHMTLTEAFNASPGYEAETLTLSMIQVFLYAICALVEATLFPRGG